MFSLKKTLKYLLLASAGIFFFATCQSHYQLTESKGDYTGINQRSGNNEQAEALIRPYRDSIEHIMNEIIGVSDDELFTARPQGNLGNFVCDLLTEEIPGKKEYDFLNHETYFSLLNTRGLRAPLNKGDILLREIFEIMPFENEIVLVKMPANSISSVGNILVEKGGHPVSSNVQLVADQGKLSFFQVNHQSPQQDFWIITSDYLANGGDDLTFFTQATEIISTGILLRDLIISHIRKLTAAHQTVNAKIDERTIFFR